MSRIRHVIKGNKSVRIPETHLFVDTETDAVKISDTERYEQFKLGWALLWNRQPKEREREFEWYEINDIDAFWLWLQSKLIDGRKITWWSHNTDFDFRVLDGYRKMKDMKYDLKHPIIDSNRVILQYHKPKSTLLVLDTFNFFKMSLRDIGEQLGVYKGEVDFKTVSDADLSKYCRQDVTVLYETIKRLLEFIVEHNLGSFGKTVASQAFNAYRHRFMHYPIYVHTNPEAIALERKSYRGGRCEAFFIGEVSNRNLHYVDVNSMYPYVMQRDEYPTKLMGVYHDVSLYRLKKMLQKYHVIADITFEIDEPAIAVKTSRLMFPIGVIDAVVCTQELRYILRYGSINKIRSVAIYDTAPIFEEYVNFFYDLKRHYKKVGNNAFLLFTKYMLNSLYGKFGQKIAPLKEIEGLKVGTEEKVISFFDVDANKWVTEYHFNGKAWIRDGFHESFDTFVAIASEVACNARMTLWEYMKIAGVDNVYYCDTDSLIVNDTGYKRLIQYINDFELGMLGKVKTKIKGIYGAKWYETDTALMLKGVKKNAKKVDKYVWKQEQFERFNTGLRKGDINKVRVKVVRKEIKPDYNKGIVQKSGWVKPYVFVEDNLTVKEINERKDKILKEKEKAWELTKKEEKRSVRMFMKESDNYEEDSKLILLDEKIEDTKNMMRRYMI